jgi:hypothetical protein
VEALQHASVRQYCKAVEVPVIAANFVRLAEQAVRGNHNHIGYLEALLAMERGKGSAAIAHRLHAMPSCPAYKTEFCQETTRTVYRRRTPGAPRLCPARR